MQSLCRPREMIHDLLRFLQPGFEIFAISCCDCISLHPQPRSLTCLDARCQAANLESTVCLPFGEKEKKTKRRNTSEHLVTEQSLTYPLTSFSHLSVSSSLETIHV